MPPKSSCYLSIPELKSKLKVVSLPITGTKAQLVARFDEYLGLTPEETAAQEKELAEAATKDAETSFAVAEKVKHKADKARKNDGQAKGEAETKEQKAKRPKIARDAGINHDRNATDDRTHFAASAQEVQQPSADGQLLPGVVTEVGNFLQSNGGQAGLSQVCGKFHLRASVVRQHFHVEGHIVKNQHPVQRLGDDKQRSKEQAEEPLPPEVVIEVGNFLQSNGGQAGLSQVCGKFHLRAAVVRQHFHVEGHHVQNQLPTKPSAEQPVKEHADEHVPPDVVIAVCTFLQTNGGQATVSQVCGKFHLQAAGVRQHFHVEGNLVKSAVADLVPEAGAADDSDSDDEKGVTDPSDCADEKGSHESYSDDEDLPGE